MALLTVGDQFPEFNLTALKGGNLREANAASPDDYFEQVTNNSYEGKWKIVFFYPKDFTFVCPTEIAAFGKLNEEFEDRDTIVLGGSGDNEFSHFNWRATNEELLKVPFPMFADVRHDLMRALGVENAVGRNVDEVLRVLDALQSEEVCACNWQKNDPTKNIDKMDVLKQELK